MTHKIVARQVIQRFQENGLRYGVLPLQEGTFVIVSERGGRVLGPFLSPESESFLWINEVFADAGRFRAFLESGDWNMGGERVWIAPEIQYSVRDRSDFWGTIHLPPEMDPGTQIMSSAGDGVWKISQNLLLEAYNVASGWKQLRVDKWVSRVDNPLRNLQSYADLMEGVLFAGYQQGVRLAETRRDEIVSESWNLVQLRPGGQVLIPTTPHPEYSDYFEPVDADHLSVESWGVRLRITGRKRYKVGIQAAQTFGRAAYFSRWGGDKAYLLVRSYFNNPSSIYAEEPPAEPGHRGRSVHVYNDGGDFGGFGELEVNGQTIGGDSGRSDSVDVFVLWFYLGDVECIRRIALLLLGASV